MSKEFQELLLKQLPRLRGYAMTLTRNASDANDLVQSAAERILKYEAHFEVGTNFAAWSFKILKNNYISNCRSNKRRLVSLDHVSGDELQPVALVRAARQEEQVLTQEVVRALDKLPPNLREIITLVCGAQLSYEEVAVVLSCSVGTVKSRMWRARDQMKALLMCTYDEEATDLPSTVQTTQTKTTWDVPPAVAG
jgi:RNA polymerase sigma-70 factor (ECF subfamily)